MIFTQQLLLVQALDGFIVYAADGVTIRKDFVPLTVAIGGQNCGFANAPGTQKQSATCHFRIFFTVTEPPQDGHSN